MRLSFKSRLLLLLRNLGIYRGRINFVVKADPGEFGLKG